AVLISEGFNETQICQECKSGFVLSQDERRCMEPPANFAYVKNCKSYRTVGNLILCNTCNNGYSKIRNQCESGCPVNNCDTCEKDINQYRCKFCRQGYTGLLIRNGTTFAECSKCSDLVK